MLTRRELVTSGAIGAIASVATASATASEATTVAESAEAPPQEVDNAALRRIAQNTTTIDQNLNGLGAAFKTNTLAYGHVPKLREAYTLYWKSHSKFPEFCEVGTDVFYDIYDWHIKNRLTAPVSRIADGRMAITFMYTQLLVRVDQTPGYIGIPFDRQ
jgi:hypothetical protein